MHVFFKFLYHLVYNSKAMDGFCASLQLQEQAKV